MVASPWVQLQKPKGTPHKFDEEKQEAFIEVYEDLKSSLPPNEALLFMDAVHPTQATKITAGQIKKGTDKPIKTTGSRNRPPLLGFCLFWHIWICLQKKFTFYIESLF